MITNTLLLIAENMATSQEKNLVSYFNCFDGITSPQFPFVFPTLFLCSQWRKDVPEELNLFMEVVVKDPTGKDFVPPLKDEAILKQEIHRINISYNGLRFTVPGDYCFQINIFDAKKNLVCSAQKIFSVKQGTLPTNISSVK